MNSIIKGTNKHIKDLNAKINLILSPFFTGGGSLYARLVEKPSLDYRKKVSYKFDLNRKFIWRYYKEF